MNFIQRIIVPGALLLLLAGCDSSETGVANPASQNHLSGSLKDIRRAIVRDQELESIGRELSTEREKRSQVESMLNQKEQRWIEERRGLDESKSRWQVAAFLCIGGCVIAIFAGAALGTRTRRDGTPR